MLSLIKTYQLINSWLEKLVLWEQSCVLCGINCPEQICRDCYHSLERIKTRPQCPRCLLYLPPKEVSCPNCAENNFYFDHIIAGYEYEFPLNKILHRLKYQGKIEYTTLLSQLFWSGISQHLTKLPNIIIPVPLHPNKHKQRGFNQVHELLREFIYANPQVPQLKIRRSKETAQQASLNRTQRINNISGAFEIDADLTKLHIAIIDDVVTSGATVNELAKVCKQSGAQQVDIWCLMRAQEHF